jgi:hypothetical protein
MFDVGDERMSGAGRAAELDRLWKIGVGHSADDPHMADAESLHDLAAEAEGGAAGALVKLLILSGARRNEVTELVRDEIKADVIELPGERTKNGLPHAIPVTPMIQGVLESLPSTGKFVLKAAGDGPVLLFANSVEHAQHLAARLCLRGVPAALIYADTDTAVRQYFIRQFLDGQIKVLANYQVLATSFDAPKTSTIVISRPVFSPVRYMQMVGRGLRGPKNGGTETCKIITVVDNLLQYTDRLAYHYFMRHYS